MIIRRFIALLAATVVAASAGGHGGFGYAAPAQTCVFPADTLRTVGRFYDPFGGDDAGDAGDIYGGDPYDGGSGGGRVQAASPALAMAGDVFTDATGFGLSLFRFRARGLDGRHSATYINGIPFNDLNRGVFNYSSLASLNPLTNRTDAALHGDPAAWTFGAAGGAENIDLRPGGLPRGFRLSATATRRDYTARATVAWSSGLTTSGVAFTIGAGGRWGDINTADIAGTFRRDIALMVGVEKRWTGGRHSISAVAWAVPYERGLQAASTREAYALTADPLYNPAWGWHGGRRRNSRTARGADPSIVVSHVWQPAPETTLTTGLAAHFQIYGGTGLYRWGGADPRPDHYTRLPSYQTDPAAAALVASLWQDGDPRTVQVDWEAMQRANALAQMTGDGAAVYIVERRHSDLLAATFNSTLDTRTGPRSRVTAGIELRAARSMQYKTVDDLLGADHIRDIDPYADSPAAAPNDLDRPARTVRRGGIFGYNYDVDIASARLWAVGRHDGRVVRTWWGGEGRWSAFRRTGLMRNGRWPDSSLGRGAVHSFTSAGFRVGAVVSLGGRNFLVARLYAGSEAPLPVDAYLSPRVTDRAVEGLTVAAVRTAEVGWVFAGRRVRGRATLFHAGWDGLTERSSYWHDELGTFVNHVLTGVATRHTGVEFAAEWKPDNAWTFTLAASAGRYVYSSDPDGVITAEDGTGGEVREKVLLRGARLGGVPQAAGVFEIEYFWRYWFFTVRGAAAALNHVSVAPSRRVASLYAVAPGHAGLSLADPSDATAFAALTAQERFPAAATVDVSVGKLLYFRRAGRRMTFNVSVVNLLDRRDIVTGGYESGRADIDNPTRHASRLYYARGRHFYVTVGGRF